MKIRIRFIKRGTMQYVGHLDLMRFFQKVFRRSGFDVAYSNGFNPHQQMSFASPLGLGLTSIGEYLDVSLQSFCINGLVTSENTEYELSVKDWIERINLNSTEEVIVTGIYQMPDDIKPSMALLAGCAYQIIGLDEMIKKDLVDYFRNVESLIYMKQTKKSVKEIDLKANILILENECTQFFDKLSQSAIFDQQYYEQYIMNGSNALYMFCVSGSSTNIKPEMLIDLYMSKNEKEIPSYDIERLDMFSFEDKYISMSCNKEGLL